MYFHILKSYNIDYAITHFAITNLHKMKCIKIEKLQFGYVVDVFNNSDVNSSCELFHSL